MKEKAPWYTVIGRITIFIGLVAIGYYGIILELCATIVVIDKLFGTNIQNWLLDIMDQYPIATWIITAITFVVWTGAAIITFVNMLAGKTKSQG